MRFEHGWAGLSAFDIGTHGDDLMVWTRRGVIHWVGAHEVDLFSVAEDALLGAQISMPERLLLRQVSRAQPVPCNRSRYVSARTSTRTLRGCHAREYSRRWMQVRGS